jgi:uncharacterized repeat protein (TIGR03803 family)
MPTLTTLVSFSSADGADQGVSLTPDAAGNLLGTTGGGGANGDGMVFEIAKTDGGFASTLSTLVSFNGTDGAGPNGVMADADGDLFGTTSAGGANGSGTVFEIPHTDGSYSATPNTLVSFDAYYGGLGPIGLMANAAGDLIGTTYHGGGSDAGTVFEIAKTNGSYANTPTTLFDFDSLNGMDPSGALITDAAGDVFGTTYIGGTYGDGTIYEIPYVNGNYASAPTTLVTFGGNSGAAPTGGLVVDAEGNLFCTTHSGGAYGDGTVIEIPYVDGSYASSPTTLVTFNGSDGIGPYGAPVIDAAGDLFGTTSRGGADDDGTIFEIAKTAGGYADTPITLVTFNGDNGAVPLTGLTTDGAGDLFGTTRFGGTSDAGTVFELTFCFLVGTRIATPTGETPVECLSPGDTVTTLHGEGRRIAWIGEGRVLAARGHRTAATPVIVRKGALADNVPHRDLHVTKGHSLYIDGALIPVEFLVNHRSILWDDRAQEVALYHIELETHDVLLANGAPAESYRDDGNRWLFRNAGSKRAMASQKPCATLLTGGKAVDAAWRRLLERAGPRPGVPITNDPDLHLMVDGRRLEAVSRRDEWQTFNLPGRPETVRIVSRSGVPQELGLARDSRCLGVALRHVMLRQGTRVRALTADDAMLTDGFHAFERADGIRWTNGDATVPAQLLDDVTGPLELVLCLGGGTGYIAEGNSLHAA